MTFPTTGAASVPICRNGGGDWSALGGSCAEIAHPRLASSSPGRFHTNPPRPGEDDRRSIQPGRQSQGTAVSCPTQVPRIAATRCRWVDVSPSAPQRLLPRQIRLFWFIAKLHRTVRRQTGRLKVPAPTLSRVHRSPKAAETLTSSDFIVVGRQRRNQHGAAGEFTSHRRAAVPLFRPPLVGLSLLTKVRSA